MVAEKVARRAATRLTVLAKPAMSTQATPRRESIDTQQYNAAEFTSLETPSALSEAELRTAAGPEQIADGDVAVYAVAVQRGVVYNTVTEHEYEATAILYATADGEQTVDRVFSRGLETIPRACLVERDTLEPAGEAEQAFAAEALATHPEVDAEEVTV